MDIEIATTVTRNQPVWSLITAKMENNDQIAVVLYNAVQKTRLSVGFTARFCRDSNIHSLVPSSFISFHLVNMINHLKPTNSLPLTFFTVQKSNASSKIITTNVSMNELKNDPRKYKTRAAVRNANKNIKACGWLECFKIDSCSILGWFSMIARSRKLGKPQTRFNA